MLEEALDQWIAVYHTREDADFNVAAFNCQGRKLAAEVKQQMGTRCQVLFVAENEDGGRGAEEEIVLPLTPTAWDIWCDGPPLRIGTWIELDFAQRRRWLALSRLANCRQPKKPDPTPGAHYWLDGQHIDDYPAFFCALGEAVHGPGGYFGSCLHSMYDCLCGGFGVTPPFTLTWRHHEHARHHLDAKAWNREIRTAYEESSEAMLTPSDDETSNDDLFEAIVEKLKRGQVRVILK